MKKIVIVNDNTNRLQTWKRLLLPVDIFVFTHPNFLAINLKEEPRRYDNVCLYLLDKMFYGKDLILDGVFDEIKCLVPKKDAKFVVTSGMHTTGDFIAGFDYVLPGRPMPLKDLMKILSKIFGENIIDY